MASHYTSQSLSPDWERARDVGWLILQRHLELGTVKKLADLRRTLGKRKSPKVGRGFSEFSSGPMLLLFAMAVYFGVTEDGFDGLKVYASAQRIAESVGMKYRSGYAPMRELKAVGAIRVIHRGGIHPDTYELPVPAGASRPGQEKPKAVHVPTDHLRKQILAGGAFTSPQQDLLLSLLVRIERLEIAQQQKGEA